MKVIETAKSTGINREARLIYQSEKEILNKVAGSSIHMRSVVVRNALFILKGKWIDDTQNLSSPTDIFNHPSFYTIVQHGVLFLPFIVEDIENAPFHWINVLQKITGENPVLPEHSGNINEMVRDWQSWLIESSMV